MSPQDGKPWCDPNSLGTTCDGSPFPNGDPYDLVDSSYSPDGYTARRRQLDESKWGKSPGDLHVGARRHMEDDTVDETASAISAGTAAASATQYGRWAYDLRSTNGHVQRIGDRGRQVIETFGGIISFNIDKCWYAHARSRPFSVPSARVRAVALASLTPPLRA